MIRGDANAIVFVNCSMIGVAGSLRDPGSVAGSQDGLHGSHQSAGRHGTFDAACAVSMFVRFTIGYGKEPAPTQARLDENPEPFGCPARFSQVAQARFILGRSAGSGET